MRTSFKVLILCAFAAASLFATENPSLAASCNGDKTGLGVIFGGDKSDLYQLQYFDYYDPRHPLKYRSMLVFDARAVSREAFGGNPGIDCGDVYRWGKNLMTVRVGWKNDLLHVYWIDYDAEGVPISVHPLFFYPHDSLISVAFEEGSNDVRLEYGRKQDVHFRFCYRDGTWFQAAAPLRKSRNFPPCTIPSGHAQPVVMVPKPPMQCYGGLCLEK